MTEEMQQQLRQWIGGILLDLADLTTRDLHHRQGYRVEDAMLAAQRLVANHQAQFDQIVWDVKAALEIVQP